MDYFIEFVFPAFDDVLDFLLVVGFEFDFVKTGWALFVNLYFVGIKSFGQIAVFLTHGCQILLISLLDGRIIHNIPRKLLILLLKFLHFYQQPHIINLSWSGWKPSWISQLILSETIVTHTQSWLFHGWDGRSKRYVGLTLVAFWLFLLMQSRGPVFISLPPTDNFFIELFVDLQQFVLFLLVLLNLIFEFLHNGCKFAILLL